jgi:hypothetical protein
MPAASNALRHDEQNPADTSTVGDVPSLYKALVFYYNH